MFVSGLKFTHFMFIFLSLTAFPYVILRIWLRKKRIVKYSPLQFHQGGAMGKVLFYLPVFLEAVMLLLLVFSAMGPYTESTRESITEKGVDIALALDISASMQAADLKPTRLEALKVLSADFIRKSGTNRISIYVFAKHTFTQSPLTTDHTVILELLDGIAYEMIDHVKSGGTAIGDALLMAAEGLMQARMQGRDQAIILITDGQSNSGIDPMTGAKYLKDNGIRLYIIGIGGDKPVEVYINGKPFINVEGKVLTTSLDDRELKKIAAASGGNYYRAVNNDVLNDIFDEISRLEATPLEVESLRARKYYRSDAGLLVLAVFALFMAVEGIIIRRPFR